MKLVIPFTSDPAQSFSVGLGTKKYDLFAQWNEAAGYWTLDISSNDTGDPLVTGVALLLGQDLLEPYGLDIGGLTVVDLSSADIEAGSDDFGTRVIVVWISTDEMDLVRAAKAAA